MRTRAACSALDDDQRLEFEGIGRIVRLKRGQSLCCAGDDTPVCATLISGALKVSSMDEHGTERILSLVYPADFVGEMFVAASRHDVTAIAESHLCVFPVEKYEQIVDRYPTLGKALLRRSSAELYASRELIDLLGRRTALQRVAGLLKAVAHGATASQCRPARRFELPLTRGEIASMLGLSIETVSRQLSRLEKDGTIAREGARGIRVKDAERLEAMVA